MQGTTKRQEPRVIIIPKPATPQTDDRGRRKRPRLLTVLLSLLALIALIHFIAVMHPGDPVAIATNCSELVRSTDYAQVVYLQTKSQEMEAVQIVSQLDGGQPAALVQVMSTGSQHSLDVYVYGCTMQQHSPKLTALFSQHSLVQGSVAISTANTLVTSELDTTLSPQAAASLQPLQQNVYREYSWQNGMFAQVAFPSLYPVTSRGEAEALQQQVNNGQLLPWSDPLTTANQMARDLFKWSANSSQGTVLSNNGRTAQVRLIQQNSHLQVMVTLERLVQQNKTGLWFVTGAQTSGIILNQPQASTLVTSPTAIEGSGALTDGQATAMLFDHTLTAISLLNNPTLNVDTKGTYSGTLFYTNSVQKQPGLLLVESLPPNGSAEAGQLLLRQVIVG